MPVKVKGWIGEFYKNHSAPIRTMFTNLVCDGCKISLDSLDEVYNGGEIGIPQFNICAPCKLSQSDYDLPIKAKECDCDDDSIICTPFNLEKGWYYNENIQSNICMKHYAVIDKSKYRYVNKDNLIKIDTSKTSNVYHDVNGKGAGFSCKAVPLILPQCITDKRYIQVSEQWFGIREHNGIISNCPWTDLVQLNGMRLNYLQDKFIVCHRQFSNICEWVPFDMIDNGSDFATYGAYAIVNCNPESSFYLKVATVVFDDHFRVSVDSLDMIIQDYLMLQAKYNKNALITKPMHNNIICNRCNVCPIIGTRWVCQECSEYDLCDKCHEMKNHSRKGKIHLMKIEKAPEVLFIEHLRIKLKQGFYFG